MVVAVLGICFFGRLCSQCTAPQWSTFHLFVFRVDCWDQCIERATWRQTVFDGVFQHQNLVWDGDFWNSWFHMDHKCIVWKLHVLWWHRHREIRGEHNASFLISAQVDNSSNVFWWRSRKYHGDYNRQALSSRSHAACRDCAIFHWQSRENTLCVRVLK